MNLRHCLRRPPAVTATEAVLLVDDGALVVDVRRQFEWNRVHIPGAGGLRSAGAANLLVENGFDAVNMSGGLIHWRAAGGPLTAR